MSNREYEIKPCWADTFILKVMSAQGDAQLRRRPDSRSDGLSCVRARARWLCPALDVPMNSNVMRRNMRRTFTRVFVLSVSIIVMTISAAGQTLNGSDPADTCEGPIYKASEVARRAAFVSPRSNPELTDEARANAVRGKVVVSAVLCRSGQVADIRVVEGLPFGVTERAVGAVREAKFTPAERDGQAVSQAVRFEFRFSYIGDRRPLAKLPLEGRMIDSVEVAGYDEGMNGEVGECMKTLSGQLYDKEMIEQVRHRLLGLGDFDAEASGVRVEESETGGLGIFYEMKKRAKE